jgi:hypothetical protein
VLVGTLARRDLLANSIEVPNKKEGNKGNYNQYEINLFLWPPIDVISPDKLNKYNPEQSGRDQPQL